MSQLQHWGIKGMKWGIRRYQNKDGSLTTAGKKRYSEDSKDSISELSDQELRNKIDRLTLEKRYRELTATPKSKSFLDEGKKMVADVLKTSGKNIATQFVTYQLGTYVNKTFGNGKDIVNPKKGQKDK